MRKRVFDRQYMTARLLSRRRVVGGVVLAGGLSYLLLASSPSGSHRSHASFVNSGYITRCDRSKTSRLSLTVPEQGCDDSISSSSGSNRRTRQTPADQYFAVHGNIPVPSKMHAVLEHNNAEESSKRRGILVIGDVHGCFDELKMLHEEAKKANGDIPFRYVILVGDLCMKGPKSAEVIRFVREQPRWLTVRGNNDDVALKAALGDVSRRERKPYKWVMDGEQKSAETGGVTLSDEDVMWMAELPYTITIPKSLLEADSYSNSETIDVIIVHAGLLPGVDLHDQSVRTMVTVRELDRIETSDPKRIEYFQHGPRKENEKATPEKPVPWAKAWKGPQQVIFGHDARRGLQLYEGNMTTGLDTGAVYGKKLTGIMLPERRLIQVDALDVYSPIG